MMRLALESDGLSICSSEGPTDWSERAPETAGAVRIATPPWASTDNAPSVRQLVVPLSARRVRQLPRGRPVKFPDAGVRWSLSCDRRAGGSGRGGKGISMPAAVARPARSRATGSSQPSPGPESLGDAPVHGDVAHRQSDDAVLAVAGDAPERGKQPEPVFTAVVPPRELRRDSAAKARLWEHAAAS
jgi:hypothetical protein